MKWTACTRVHITLNEPKNQSIRHFHLHQSDCCNQLLYMQSLNLGMVLYMWFILQSLIDGLNLCSWLMWGLVTIAPAIYALLWWFKSGATWYPFHPLHEGVATCTTLFSPTPDGKIIRIVHAKGQTEISKAEHWVRLFTHSYIGTHIYIDDCCNCYFFVTPLTEVLSRSWPSPLPDWQEEKIAVLGRGDSREGDTESHSARCWRTSLCQPLPFSW